MTEPLRVEQSECRAPSATMRGIESERGCLTSPRRRTRIAACSPPREFRSVSGFVRSRAISPRLGLSLAPSRGGRPHQKDKTPRPPCRSTAAIKFETARAQQCLGYPQVQYAADQAAQAEDYDRKDGPCQAFQPGGIRAGAAAGDRRGTVVGTRPG